MSRLRRPLSVVLTVALAGFWLATSTTPVAAKPVVTSSAAAVPGLMLMADDWTWTAFGGAVYGGAAGGAVRGAYTMMVAGPVAAFAAGGTGALTGGLVGAVAYAASYAWGRAVGGDDGRFALQGANADLLLN